MRGRFFYFYVARSCDEFGGYVECQSHFESKSRLSTLVNVAILDSVLDSSPKKIKFYE